MNTHFRNVIFGTLVLGSLFGAAVHGQQPTLYGGQPVMYAQPAYAVQPVAYVSTTPQPTGEPYLRLYGNTGGVSVTANYGCGQQVAVVQGSRSYALETNQPQQGFAYAIEVDRRATCDVGQAMDVARKVAPVMITGNPCPPQYCAPQRDTCGRTVSADTCSMTRPACASPCATEPYWCARTSRWCTRTGNHWCDRSNRWCNTSSGQYWCNQTHRWCHATARTGGSCCSGGDGRNPMVHYAPGVAHAGCSCAANPNGPGGDCACPPTCPQCNPNQVVGYVGYGR